MAAMAAAQAGRAKAPGKSGRTLARENGRGCGRGRGNSTPHARVRGGDTRGGWRTEGGPNGVQASTPRVQKSATHVCRAKSKAKSSGKKTGGDGKSQGKFNILPVFEKTFADHLNPILAYRCLTKDDDRQAPSFLFESVQNGDQAGRYSFIGSQPKIEVFASEDKVTVLNHKSGSSEVVVSRTSIDFSFSPVVLTKLFIL